MAVTSTDSGGLRDGLRWCIDQREESDHITVWTHELGNLRNNPLLEKFAGSPGIDHVTARGGSFLRHPGPVLMAWADPSDIAGFVHGRAQSIRALCVVSWNENKLRPWVAYARPELLGDVSVWEVPIPMLDSEVEAEMRDATDRVNHNNSISGGR